MYDLTIIGAGPAGYTAAKRAADLGANVCLIEKEQLGGVCLNKGCIPTKFMINTAKLLSAIKEGGQFGVEAQDPKLNVEKMLERRDSIIEKHRRSIERLLNKSKVKVIKGEAKIEGPNSIDVSGEKIETKNIIIATGSVPIETDNLKFNHKNIISGADLLSLKKVPSSLIIIGAGYIGCEFACIYNRFGTDITVIEIASQVLPGQDKEIARRLAQSMRDRGIKILFDSKIKSLKSKADDKVTAVLEDNRTIEARKALLTIGRNPNTTDLGLESVGVKLENGSVAVDDNLKSSAGNIYAIGDVIGRHCLAHTAFYEGAIAAENIFKQPRTADYGAIPNCIYTIPEVASTGLTETQAKQEGHDDAAAASYSFMASSKAHIIGQTKGIIKLVTDSKTGKILGAQIFGPEACELIHELVVAIHNNMTAKELSGVIHAHPTLSEGIQEVARKTGKSP